MTAFYEERADERRPEITKESLQGGRPYGVREAAGSDCDAKRPKGRARRRMPLHPGPSAVANDLNADDARRPREGSLPEWAKTTPGGFVMSADRRDA